MSIGHYKFEGDVKIMTSKQFQMLRDFIQNRMSMSHIYQPAMLIELLRKGGEASVRDIAKALLGEDVSQLEYYDTVTKGMVGKVLTNHQITEKIYDGRKVTGFRVPAVNELTEAEIEDLISQCLDKVNDYVAKRGDKIWSHRRKSSGNIPCTIRYEVLKRAKFRCELCGISAEEKALEVDHIIPRNKGGKDDISNFQALCYSHNAMKRDRDDTDFRGIAESYKLREKDCLFCDFQSGEEREIVAENELCYAIRDGMPVTDLHTLIIPKRHIADYFELHQPEINAIHSLLDEMRKKIVDFDSSVTAFNVGINSGKDAGQTIFHCHIHLIPRRKGDMDNPRGGVRGVIPDKRIY